MEALLGFQVSVWDYVTFAAIFIIVLAGLAAAIFILGLPGRIAIARNHPEADAVNLMGWIGFVAVVPWVQALIWAFKPTDVVDLRYLPKQRQRETADMLARLRGGPPLVQGLKELREPAAPPSESPPP
jgi:hypothetical protein